MTAQFKVIELPPIESLEPTITCDNSKISDYRGCPRAFQYRHVEFLIPAGPEALYKAEFGSALHEGYEIFYKGGTLEEAITAFIEYFTPYAGQDDIRTIDKGKIILTKYFNEVLPNDLERYEVVHTEMGAAILIDDFIFTLKMDGLLKEKTSGEYILLEHKNSAHRGFLIAKPNSQVDGYIKSVRDLMGINFNRAFLNQIYFRKGKRGENQWDTVSFVREETRRSDNEITEWINDARYWFNRIKESIKTGFFPRNTDHCTNYGKCQYLPLCQMEEGPMQDAVKRSAYVEKKWEPFKGAHV